MSKLTRKQRQKLKQKQQKKLLNSGFKQSEINKLSNRELEQEYTSIVTKEHKKNQRKQQNKKRAESRAKKLDFKRNSLDTLGFNPKYATRVKYDDIESYKNGNLNALSREKYPFLYYEKKFDFNKVYEIPDGQRMYIAYRDQQGEIDFSDELDRFNELTNDQLIDRLEYIVRLPRDYTGKGSASSGKAGGYRFYIASENAISLFNNDTYNVSRKDKRYLAKQQQGKDAYYKTKKGRKKKRAQFKGEKVGFQVLKDDIGRVSYDKVTPRNLLIIANAIMYNVTEVDRESFYERFYDEVTAFIPEMIKILPEK